MLLAFHMIALLAALTFMTYRQYKEEVEKQTYLADAARVFAIAETEEFIEEIRITLSKLSAYSSSNNIDQSSCNRLMLDIQYLSKIFANLITLDKEGRLVCSVKDMQNTTRKGPDPKYYFAQAALTNQFTIGKPAVGFLTGQRVITFAYPTQDEQGQFNGVVGIAIDLLNFKPFISSRGLPKGAYSGILNTDGVMVTVSEGGETLIGKEIARDVFEKMSSVQEGTFLTTDQFGHKRLMSVGPIRNTDWILYVSLDFESVLSPIAEKTRRRILFILFITTVLGLMTVWVARRIARPFESILRTVVKVGEGDTQTRAIPSGPIEAQQIALRLNEMLDARERATSTLRQSETRFKTAFRTIPDALVISRLSDGLYIEVNDAFIAQSGWSRQDIVGKTSIDLKIWRFKSERDKLENAIREHGECTNFEAELQSKDGRVWIGLISAHVITIDDIHCILSITRDITDIRKSQETIFNLSFSDALTGLPNRRTFMDRLEQAVASNIRNQTVGAIILINLDNLKGINEALGHTQGDLLLQEVANRLTSCSRTSETVARIEGDEFVILMPELSDHAEVANAVVIARCEELLNALNLPYQLENAKHHRTARIGAALFGEDSANAYELLQRAEIAVHKAKESGLKRFSLFEPHMQAAVDARLSLEGRLRDAIEQSKLVLYYQAQVTKSGRVTGVEVLVRWHDSLAGTISPTEFIPLAEETGLIVPLGLWVLESACIQIKSWENHPILRDISVSLNVSAHQFAQDGFVENVRQALKRNGVNPFQLKLELTESVLISNPSTIIAKMQEISSIGVQFSLDDFGTGYSSLAYLKRLPLNQIKIDQIFVRDMLTSSSDAGIIKMIISMAASMNITVIAEGVETEGQLNKLAEMGCSIYQGYLFCRPVQSEEFERFVDLRGD